MKVLSATFWASTNCMATFLFRAYLRPWKRRCIARILSPLRAPKTSPK